MIRSLYTAAASLATVALRLGVASNNAANVSTVGYKQDRVPLETGKALDFARLLDDQPDAPLGPLTLGPHSGLAELDLSQGTLEQTGHSLDLALGGAGFFTVRGADGQTRYTRDGGFHLDRDGSLRARDGSSVLDATGQPIQLTSADVDVDETGTIDDGTQTVQLGLADFAEGSDLQKVGNSQFETTAAASQPGGGTRVLQGCLEGSNVSLVETMSASMSLARAYEANQRMLQMSDETLARAVNDVGKV